MTPIDDLKPGDFITPVSSKREDADCFSFRRAFKTHGVPFEVLAISLPFIAVKAPNGIGTIDVRDFEVQRLDRKYVEAMQGAVPQRPGRKRKKKLPEQADPQRCVRCGSMMIQRWLAKQGWLFWCETCNALGGRVPE